MTAPPLLSVRVGTRGSQLARAQTGWIIQRLARQHPGLSPLTVAIATTGDHSASAPLGTGVFVKEIQQALLDHRIDMAVHSLKDLPTEPAPGLVIAAIPERADPRDALVGSRLDALGPGAVVGTGSPRRAAQLRRLRPDLGIVAVRGNISTRIERARAGEVAAVMLAAAGLQRLGIAAEEVLSAADVLPAPGQGALAAEIREDDQTLADLLASLEDAATRTAVVAERAVLRALGGGCLLPVAAYGRIEGHLLVLEASVTAADGSSQVRARAQGDPGLPGDLGAQVARSLVDQGALDLLHGLDPLHGLDLPAARSPSEDEARHGR